MNIFAPPLQPAAPALPNAHEWIIFVPDPDALGAPAVLNNGYTVVTQQNCDNLLVATTGIAVDDSAAIISRNSAPFDACTRIYIQSSRKIRTYTRLVLEHQGRLYHATSHVVLVPWLLEHWRQAAHIMLQVPLYRALDRDSQANLWPMLDERCGRLLPHLVTMIVTTALLQELGDELKDLRRLHLQEKRRVARQTLLAGI